MVTVNSSAEALTGPACTAIVPAGSDGCRCTPRKAPTGRAASSADSTMSRAPEGSDSSRGCSTASAGRGPPASRSARPKATSAAMCTSCPQACMAPFTEAHGAPVVSATGSASSSARMATSGPGPAPISISAPSVTRGASGAPSAAVTSARRRPLMPADVGAAVDLVAQLGDRW